MKEFSFYLFFLYLFFKVKSLEYEIKSIEINDIFYNYIDIDDKKFLLNPRSEKVVLFGNCQTSKILQSDNKEIDYFDFLRLEIENSCKLDINIDNKPIHFDNVYLFTDKDPFKNMDGYIGIKNGANFIKTLGLKKKHGYKQKQKVNNNNEKFYLGKEVKIDDDYNDDSNFVSIEPALDDDDELSLSLSQFTFKSISKIKDKYQYEIDKENGNYIDSKNKVFISLFLSNYHIAPIDWIEKVLNECGLKKDVDYTENIDVVNYLNIKLTKFEIKNDAKVKENFNFIFDSSTAINIDLINDKNDLTFLGYKKEEYKVNDIFLSSSRLDYSVNFNFDESILTIIGDDDKLCDIESFVPVVLFIISCIIVVIIIIGVVFIIRKNKNNNSTIDNQDNNMSSSGLVPN
jgi:hypothetical protein